MAIHQDHRATRHRSEQHIEAHAWGDRGFVLVRDVQPPPRIELARERMLICRLYIGLIQSITDDYEFATRSDSATLRSIGIYVFLRTVMCSPVSTGKIRSRAETAARDRAEAAARLGEAGLRGAHWERLSRHRQSEYSRPATEAPATHRHDHGHCKKTVRIGRHGKQKLSFARFAAVGHVIRRTGRGDETFVPEKC